MQQQIGRQREMRGTHRERQACSGAEQSRDVQATDNMQRMVRGVEEGMAAWRQRGVAAGMRRFLAG